MKSRRAVSLLFALCAIPVVLPTSRPLWAVTVRVDFSQDQTGFFSAVTTEGQQARQALNAAAGFYSGLLRDTLDPVVIPGRYESPSNPGWAEFYLDFANPSNPFDQNDYRQLSDYDIERDEFVIFVGGAPIGGTQIASAGMGGVWTNYELYTPAEVDHVLTTLDAFSQQTRTRGEASGYANWGGTISFDNDGSTTWNRGLELPGAGQSDLFSVALHEMAHVLGLSRGVMNELGLVNASDKFIGAAAVASYGAPVPLQPGGSHWAEGTTSTILGAASLQETLYDPSFNSSSVRKLLTELDAAALADLGWSVALDEVMLGDLNYDGSVDAADYSAWRKGLNKIYSLADYQLWRSHFGTHSTAPASASFAPEPASAALLMLALLSSQRRRR